MALRQLDLRSADGTRLAGVAAPASGDPRGVVFIAHGHGEHVGRYNHVFAALNNARFAAYAVDLRGHGRSDGKRGHVRSWSNYVADVATTFAAAERDGLGQRPWFQLGHSMGGLVAVHVALAHAERLHGLALSGPLLGIAMPVPPIKAAIGRLLSRYWPTLTMPTGLSSSALSHDLAVVQAYDSDPLVHDRVSTRWFTEMNAAMATAHACAPRMRLPLLLLHGSNDKLTDPEGSRRFLDAYGGPKDAEFYAGFYHEVFNEVERERPLKRLTDWLTAQTG